MTHDRNRLILAINEHIQDWESSDYKGLLEDALLNMSANQLEKIIKSQNIKVKTLEYELCGWNCKEGITKDTSTPMIELRKTFHGGTNHANVLILVRPRGIEISTNGKIEMPFGEMAMWDHVISVASEKLQFLNEVK